jgi:hypothetical protein
MPEPTDTEFYRELIEIIQSVPANKRHIVERLLVATAEALAESHAIDVSAAAATQGE